MTLTPSPASLLPYSSPPLRVLVVDDEPLARARLVTLLGDCRSGSTSVVLQASRSVEAMEMIVRESVQSPFDLVLLDIHMPGMSGLNLAQHLSRLPSPPAVIFVTAHAEHALQAFELDAVDYLTKPVRLERLQAALQKVQRLKTNRQALQLDLAPDTPLHSLLIQDRGRTERVPLAEVLYFKAELKYLTVRTAHKSHILDGVLNDLEEQYPQFLRIHRNALVARHALRALDRQYSREPGEEVETWVVRLNGLDEVLAVSRRQLAAVRAVLAGGG